MTKQEKPIIICQDHQGRWCAGMLKENYYGSRWVLLDQDRPVDEAVADVIFAFTGTGPPHHLALVETVSREIVRNHGKPGLLEELDRAVPVDVLFPVPDWVRKAAS